MIQECSENKDLSPSLVATPPPACDSASGRIKINFPASILAVRSMGRDFLPNYVSLPSLFLLSSPTQLSLESPHRSPKASQPQAGNAVD
jgi:hypothetical protein